MFQPTHQTRANRRGGGDVFRAGRIGAEGVVEEASSGTAFRMDRGVFFFFDKA